MSNAFAGGLDPLYVWDFDNSTEGWYAAGDTNIATNPGYLKVWPGGSTSCIYSSAISVSGVTGRYVRISFRASATGIQWLGWCCYATSGHGYNSSAYRKDFALPANSTAGPTTTTEMTVVELDMWDLTVGGTDYRDSTVTGLMFYFNGSWQGAPMAHVDWIAIGQRNGKLLVETRMLRDGAVTTAKHADGSVTAAKLGAGAVVGHLGYTPRNIAAKVVRAYRATSAQNVSTGVWTKVSLNAEETDTDGCFDSSFNYRFTPTTAGYYRVSWAVNSQTVNTRLFSRLYLNGAGIYLGSDVQGASASTVGSGVCYLNGSTDYLELYAYVTGGGATSVNFGQYGTYLHTEFAGV